MPYGSTKPTHILCISRDRTRLETANGEIDRLTAEARESELRFRVLADTMPQMVWSTRPDGFHDYYNARWYEFMGMPAESTDGEGWNGMFHPGDQERAWDRWRQSLRSGRPYEIGYRLRHHSGEYRWVLGRALPYHRRSPPGNLHLVRRTHVLDHTRGVRYVVGTRLVPMAKTAGRLHLTLAEFRGHLPALRRDGFPAACAITRHFDLKAIHAWLGKRSKITESGEIDDFDVVAAMDKLFARQLEDKTKRTAERKRRRNGDD